MGPREAAVVVRRITGMPVLEVRVVATLDRLAALKFLPAAMVPPGVRVRPPLATPAATPPLAAKPGVDPAVEPLAPPLAAKPGVEPAVELDNNPPLIPLLAPGVAARRCAIILPPGVALRPRTSRSANVGLEALPILNLGPFGASLKGDLLGLVLLAELVLLVKAWYGEEAKEVVPPMLTDLDAPLVAATRTFAAPLAAAGDRL